MPVAVDPRIGTELAGYRLESVLGRGGMGVVYMAEDLRLSRRVAVKLVAPELAADPRFRERFLRESELAASFEHSHVVPVYAAGETDGQLWLAMRYVEGEDLAALLAREGPLEPVRAVDLCAQVGEALDAAHERGLVHRDVKPANVLVTVEGGREHAYLTDFGLARGTDADTSAPTHLSGTVDYTAPEQIAHEPLDGRADVYSLGCVLYECLAGEPPFRRPRPMATLFAHSSEEPPSLHQRRPELSEVVDGVVANALAKEPEERYVTCGELTDAASEALGLEPRTRFTRRRLLALGAGGALAAAAAAAVPAILLGRGDPAPAVALPVTANTLLRIDPETGEPLAGVPLGEDPTHLAAGGESLWVFDSREQKLFRVDPERDAVVDSAEISSIEGVVSGLRAGAGSAWLETGGIDSRIWRYDADTGSLTEVASGELIQADDDGLWVWDDVTPIIRLDATTGRAREWIAFDLEPTRDEALVDESVWLWSTAFDAFGALDAVDRQTGVRSSVDTGLTTIDEVTLGEGAVWALGDGGSLVRIDPETRLADQPIHVGRSADSMAIGQGYVWVGSSRDGTVTRVDPETADLFVINVGGRPRAITVADGGVWVIVRPA